VECTLGGIVAVTPAALTLWTAGFGRSLAAGCLLMGMGRPLAAFVLGWVWASALRGRFLMMVLRSPLPTLVLSVRLGPFEPGSFSGIGAALDLPCGSAPWLGTWFHPERSTDGGLRAFLSRARLVWPWKIASPTVDPPGMPSFAAGVAVKRTAKDATALLVKSDS